MTYRYSPAWLTVRSPWRLLWLGLCRALHQMIASAVAIFEVSKMSNTEKTLVDTFGPNDVPDFSRFGDGVSSLTEVQESLRRRDEFRNEQNEQREKGGPVRRDR